MTETREGTLPLPDWGREVPKWLHQDTSFPQKTNISCAHATAAPQNFGSHPDRRSASLTLGSSLSLRDVLAHAPDCLFPFLFPCPQTMSPVDFHFPTPAPDTLTLCPALCQAAPLPWYTLRSALSFLAFPEAPSNPQPSFPHGQPMPHCRISPPAAPAQTGLRGM